MPSVLRLDCSTLPLREFTGDLDIPSILLLACLGGGGGGGSVEARLFISIEISMLDTDGGRPDADRVDPRGGGGVGVGVRVGEGCIADEPDGIRIDPGLRVGGSGGALKLSALDLLVLVVSSFESSSSGFGERRFESLRETGGSATRWLCLLARGGAGGVFLRGDEDGDGGSGILPAASLSKTDSRSRSLLARLGGAGRGLLRSVWESNDSRGLEL